MACLQIRPPHHPAPTAVVVRRLCCSNACLMRQMTLLTPEDGPTQPRHIDGIPRAWQGVARGWQQRHQAVPKSHRKVQCQGCVKGKHQWNMSVWADSIKIATATALVTGPWGMVSLAFCTVQPNEVTQPLTVLVAKQPCMTWSTSVHHDINCNL